MLAWILDHAGLQPGFLIGGVAVDFDVSARCRLTRQLVLRHRRRRIRHRVLRQALEVRPLPAAHRDPQQSRVRSCRYFSRPRSDRDAVPSSGAHGPAPRPADRQRRRRRACNACLRAAAGARSSASAWPRWPIRAPTGRSPSTARSSSAARRRACSNRSRCSAGTTSSTRWQRSPPRATSACPSRTSLAALAVFRGVKRRLELRGNGRRRHRLRRFRAPSDGDCDDDRRPAPRSRSRAHLRDARAAVEHDEAGHDESALPASLEAADRVVLLRGESRLECGRRARAAGEPRQRPRRSRCAGRRRSCATRNPAIICWS